MSEDVNGGESPHDRAWTNRMATIRVPAPMSEDVNGGESPHDRAWTNRMATIRVPAPMREEVNGNAQPLDFFQRIVNWSPLPDLNWGHPDVC
jgi:hypothetical protein